MLLNDRQKYIEKRAEVLEELIYKSLCRGEVHIKNKCGESELVLYKDGIKKLSELDIERIGDFIDEVCEVYPKIMGAYYIEFFIACQDACDKYLDEINT